MISVTERRLKSSEYKKNFMLMSDKHRKNVHKAENKIRLR
ncbi:15932_t:CDS:2 [Funneliformis geosporum]|nr:15932_t:CDS:2 [Funneliformis geosporum]